MDHNNIVARIDIKFSCKKEDIKQFKVIDSHAKTTNPAWFQTDGIGYVIQSDGNRMHVIFSTNCDADVKLILRGIDERDSNGNSIPKWVKYTKLIVNGKLIFDKSCNAWHNEAMQGEFEVDAISINDIIIEWNQCNCNDEFVFIENDNNILKISDVIYDNDISLKTSESDFNFFRYNLNKNTYYNAEILCDNPDYENFTVGVFNFTANEEVHYDIFSTKKKVNFNFQTGSTIDEVALVIYAGIHRHTRGNNLNFHLVVKGIDANAVNKIVDYNVSRDNISIENINNIDIAKCISYVESDSNCIYLYSGNKYSGYAITSDLLTNMIDDYRPELQYRVKHNYVKKIPKVNLLGSVNDNSIKEQITEAISVDNLNINELPIADNDRIVSVIKRKNDQIAESKIYDWSVFKMDLLGNDLGNLFDKYDKYIISSIQNDNLKNFYDFWHDKINLEILNTDNLSEIFSDKCQLIYVKDIFPECNKIKIDAIYDEAVKKYTKSYMWLTDVNKEYPAININQVNDWKVMIEYFNNWNNGVVVNNEDGTFYGVILQNDIKETLVDGISKIRKNWSIINKNNIAAKREFLTRSMGSNIQAIPVIKNKKCTALVEKITRTYDTNIGKTFFHKFRLNWLYISDEVAFKIIEKGTRILLSSKENYLGDFYQRFFNIYDIKVFDKYEDLDYKNFDLLIYNAEIWGRNFKKISITDLYQKMLSEEILQYITKLGVKIYCFNEFSRVKIVNHKARMLSMIAFKGEYDSINDGDYYVYRDTMNSNGFCVKK